MQLTCPKCRHVWEFEAQSTQCPNCLADERNMFLALSRQINHLEDLIKERETITFSYLAGHFAAVGNYERTVQSTLRNAIRDFLNKSAPDTPEHRREANNG